jgi:hypothetical protein
MNEATEPPRPMIAYVGNQPGTGKSPLVAMACALVPILPPESLAGVPPEVMNGTDGTHGTETDHHD